jgi:hypothetical protein
MSVVNIVVFDKSRLQLVLTARFLKIELFMAVLEQAPLGSPNWFYRDTFLATVFSSSL